VEIIDAGDGVSLIPKNREEINGKSALYFPKLLMTAIIKNRE